MSNLIFLSGIDSSDNAPALGYVREVFPEYKTLGYLPAQLQDSKQEVKNAKRDFKKIGVRDFNFLPLERFSPRELKEKIKDCDILFLGGGNTFYFYDMLLKKKLLGTLKEHVRKGKLIMGLSAGAILLTPSLLLACYPDIDADEYFVKLKSLKALNLVPFEIYPHYKNSKKVNSNLGTYTALYPHPVYGIRDGDFIVYSKKQGPQVFGELHLFHRGEKLKLT